MTDPADNDVASHSHSRRWRLWLSLLLGAGLAIALAAVALVLTDDPPFCASCHEMEPAYEGWLGGSHAEDADCMDCHADAGAVGYLRAHVAEGLRDVYIHFIEGAPEQVTDSHVPQARCLRCHDDDFADPGFPGDHPGKAEYCPECHRDRIHVNDR